MNICFKRNVNKEKYEEYKKKLVEVQTTQFGNFR